MKIISKYKDFYDYLQHLYGQDLNVVWYRDYLDKDHPDKKFLDIDFDKYKTYEKSIHNYGMISNNIFSKSIYFGLTDDKVTLLSILGDVYFIVERVTSDKNGIYNWDGKKFTYGSGGRKYNRFYSVVDHEIYKKLNKEAEKICKLSASRYIHRFMLDRDGKDDYERAMSYYKENKERLIQFHKDMKAPILFVSTERYRRNVSLINQVIPLSSIPNLVSELGSPEKLYQRFYNFFIEINDNVDLKPPVEISNKDKISEAGFDLKFSFRHPTKL